jgi:hypothetical protein
MSPIMIPVIGALSLAYGPGGRRGVVREGSSRNLVMFLEDRRTGVERRSGAINTCPPGARFLVRGCFCGAACAWVA